VSRIRLLFPSYFKNHDLAQCPPAARLLFAGLWGLADRAGRLEDIPPRLWAEVFPYEPSVDVDALLWTLAARGFVVRYTDADGAPLLAIPQFLKFQKPHQREQASTLPAPDAPGCTRRAPSENANDARLEVHIPTLIRPSGNRYTVTGDIPPAAAEYVCAPPEQLTLEGIPELALVKPARKMNSRKRAPLPECPQADLVRDWCACLPMLAAPLLPLDATTQRHLRARWRELAAFHRWEDDAPGRAWFHGLFCWLGRSRFLMGYTGPRRVSAVPFELTLAWLVVPSHWARVRGGLYHDDGARGQP
jgi:hypothetical protein